MDCDNLVTSQPPPPPPARAKRNPAMEAPKESVCCQCYLFLDPYPTQLSWRSAQSLQHYCHVCNTQLNSCKQARIHVGGKKHEKRLAYLKYSLETSELDSSVPAAAPPPPAPIQQNYTAPPQPVSYSVVTHTNVPPPVTAMAPMPPPPHACYASYPSFQPPPPPTNYYYHHGAPPTSTYSTSPLQQATYTASFHEFVPAAPPPPIQQTSPPMHGVMSPGLTSGFSGSGVDCCGKSTETSSILSSAASFCSTTQQPVINTQNQTTVLTLNPLTESQNPMLAPPPPAPPVPPAKPPPRVVCETCQIPFPSQAVLDNHLLGTRHAKKIKSQQMLRHLQEPSEFRPNGGAVSSGEIRCEVCQVSVNSSHQLQAHLEGHKHKIRCFRRGLHPNTALLTPNSSTPPSTTPSEYSAPTRFRPPDFVKFDKTRTSLLVVPPPTSNGRAANGGLLGAGPMYGRGLLPTPPSLGPSGGSRPNNLYNSIQPSAQAPNGQRRRESGNKQKTRKVARQFRPKENDGSTTESDDPPEKPGCDSSASSTDKAKVKQPPPPTTESSDEAKESSEGDAAESPGIQDQAKDQNGNNTTPAQVVVTQNNNNNNNNNNNGVVVNGTATNKGVAFKCDICNVNLNSASQMKQHMNSPKHQVKASEHQWASETKENPMLNMFLQTLHTHQYFPSTSDKENEDSSTTEVER